MKVIDLVRISSDITTSNVGDTELSKFTIVCNDRKGQGHFFKACAWRKTSELIRTYLKKGDMMHIEGEIENNNYTNKEGAMVYQDLVTIHSIKFVPRAKEEHNQGEYKAPVDVPADKAIDRVKNGVPSIDVSEELLPF